MTKNPDGSVTLTEKEYERIVLRIACNEYGHTEQQMLEWANDDMNDSWAGDKWSKINEDGDYIDKVA